MEAMSVRLTAAPYFQYVKKDEEKVVNGYQIDDIEGMVAPVRYHPYHFGILLNEEVAGQPKS